MVSYDIQLIMRIMYDDTLHSEVQHDCDIMRIYKIQKIEWWVLLIFDYLKTFLTNHKYIIIQHYV
jgi:hypothetical protein